MGGYQNYGPLLGPEYRNLKGDHNFDNHQHAGLRKEICPKLRLTVRGRSVPHKEVVRRLKEFQVLRLQPATRLRHSLGPSLPASFQQPRADIATIILVPLLSWTCCISLNPISVHLVVRQDHAMDREDFGLCSDAARYLHQTESSVYRKALLIHSCLAATGRPKKR